MKKLNLKSYTLLSLILSASLSLSSCAKVEINTPTYQQVQAAVQEVKFATQEHTEKLEKPAEVLSLDTEEDKARVEAYFGPLPKIEKIKAYDHVPVKGLYIRTGYNLDKVIEICNSTVINAVVIDLKESYGFTYESKIPLAVETQAPMGGLDVKALVQKLHDNNIRVIGRITCFKDEFLAVAKPEMCLKGKDGKPLRFPLEGNATFVSPYNKDIWQYIVDIADEGISMGVDEIQFDFVRFPSGGSESGEEPYLGADKSKIPSRSEAINRFVEYARALISDKQGVPIGLDCFASTILFPRDAQIIGQDWNTMGMTGVAVISPMIYPSHFANDSLDVGGGGNGYGTEINGILYKKPDLDPQTVVFQTLLVAQQRISARNKPVFSHIRPYLQAFDASWLSDGTWMHYGPKEIKEQIKAVNDAGYDEFLLWNVFADYTEDMFEPKDSNSADTNSEENEKPEQTVSETSKTQN